MKKIGITGQNGFIGIHLINTIKLFSEEFAIIPFENNFFADKIEMENFVSNCDAIVHLAAKNRHNDPDVIYMTNIDLVKKLINALENTKSKPHLIFASSTQELKESAYGKSKKEGRLLLENWAIKNNAEFTGMIIPNVFGPFGHPYYNSFIATFCHKLSHNETPQIEIDAPIGLIFINELITYIIESIRGKFKSLKLDDKINFVTINPTSTFKVSEILNKLIKFKEDYFTAGIIPDISSEFNRNLFITFLCYIDHKTFFPFYLKKNTDARGSFVEAVKLNSGGQVSFSTTAPGVTRGNHFHTRKAERFAVIKGKAKIELRKIGTEEVLSFELDGNKPSFVDMPVWYTHNIKNIGEEELYTIFWINEYYDPTDPDTYFVNV